MQRTALTFVAFAVAVVLCVPASSFAQLDDTATWASHLSNTYRVVPNVTYGVANNRENTVDLYLPRGADGPTPVLMYIHGGGWVGGSKESSVLRLLPWLEKGWAVVNVQYLHDLDQLIADLLHTKRKVRVTHGPKSGQGGVVERV